MAKLFVLLGPSGVGKTSVLRYLQKRIGVDAAPKYTTRENRGTRDDSLDFVFCGRGDYPTQGLLTFESYGELFGIQLAEVTASFERGNGHAVVVGTGEVVKQLKSTYPGRVVAILVFCELDELRRRIERDKSARRMKRWPKIVEETEAVYSELGSVDFVIDNSGPIHETHRSLDRLLGLLE